MCGIVGLILAEKTSHVRQELYTGLTMLQHRGQSSTGIVTTNGDKVTSKKDFGLVSEVFSPEQMIRILGSCGIGHVSCPTSASASLAECQPFYTNTPYGLSIALDGNLTNFEDLSRDIRENHHRHTNTDSDCELMLNIFANSLLDQLRTGAAISCDSVFNSVRVLMTRCCGAFSCVALIHGFGLLAFRDPHGIRPLCMGRRESPIDAPLHDFCFASESVTLDALGFNLEGDLMPGEAVLVTMDGELHRRVLLESPAVSYTPCLFEYVYIARSDSVMNGVSVHLARNEMGRELARVVRERHPDDVIDLVVPIPETSRPAALQVAKSLGLPYAEGLVQNRYFARNFIVPGQKLKLTAVRQRLSPVASAVKGKNILLIDDSVVRGTTSTQIISMLKAAGAQKVFFAIASPPVRYPNLYGIDMPTFKELIAHEQTEAEIAEDLGADWICYLDLRSLQTAVLHCQQSPLFEDFDSSCFDGIYVDGCVSQDDLETMDETERGRRK